MANCLNDSITIFMSKVSDPFNFDYAPAVPVPADSAWSGRTGSQGLLGFPVTALIPYTDDLLIVGMEKGIAVFRGDPMAGGQLDNVTTDIGIAFGQAWCMDSTGTVYFFSSHTGVFAFIPAQGAKPQRISQAIDSLLLDIDTGQYGIRMAWWDRRKELHVFVTLLDTQQDTTHYVWESQSNSWWEDTYQDTNMNPLCCVGFDGNLQEDRVVLLGSWDGYVRALDQDAEDDDGEMILSQVMMGPFLTKFNDDVMVNDLQAVMAKDSDEVTFAIYAGKTAEEALVSTPVKSGTWTEGRNFTNLIRKSANALYVFATSTGRWAAENWRLTIDTLGKVRQRGNAAG
jgi:hypothetical protein